MNINGNIKYRAIGLVRADKAKDNADKHKYIYLFSEKLYLTK